MTHPDIAALESLTERFQHRAASVVKDITHDANGRITKVIERHQPFDTAAEIREGNKLVRRLNETPLSVEDSLAYADAYVSWARAAAELATPESRHIPLDTAERMERAALKLARQPGAE